MEYPDHRTWEFQAKDGRSLVVREAVAPDAEQLLEKHNAIIMERLDSVITQPGDARVTLMQEQLWIEEQARQPNSVLLVAEYDGEIAGWAVLRGGKRKRTRHTGVLGLTVACDWRGLGVGTGLMKALLEWAEENPLVEKIKLSVVDGNNPALRLYAKLGFVEQGRQPREFKKDDGSYMDGIQMYRFLDKLE